MYYDNTNRYNQRNTGPRQEERDNTPIENTYNRRERKQSRQHETNRREMQQGNRIQY